MIYVGGQPIPSSSSSPLQGDQTLAALLEHPLLVSATNSFKEVPELKVSNCDNGTRTSYQPKNVYIFQREYATVEPAYVDVKMCFAAGMRHVLVACVVYHIDFVSNNTSLQQYIGTDEATTCVGLIVRNKKDGITSVAHFDSPKVIAWGLDSMLSSFNDATRGELDVHLIGGYEDLPLEQLAHIDESDDDWRKTGFSWPLCSEIIEVLHSSSISFHVQTLCVLGHNTSRDNVGSTRPIVSGFLVETRTGFIRPACFDRSSRIPDELVRRVRVSFSSEDPTWKGKLLKTYDTHEDKFYISPCQWDPSWKKYALQLLKYSDSDLLQISSTSPDAEGPEFIGNVRRVYRYLIENPDWRRTFHLGKPRVFARNGTGGWIRCE